MCDLSAGHSMFDCRRQWWWKGKVPVQHRARYHSSGGALTVATWGLRTVRRYTGQQISRKTGPENLLQNQTKLQCVRELFVSIKRFLSQPNKVQRCGHASPCCTKVGEGSDSTHNTELKHDFVILHNIQSVVCLIIHIQKCVGSLCDYT